MDPHVKAGFERFVIYLEERLSPPLTRRVQ